MEVWIFHSIQTNGDGLDEAWAEFFRKENYLVGLSMDGTGEFHNRHRMDAGGKGIYGQILKTASYFRNIKWISIF